MATVSLGSLDLLLLQLLGHLHILDLLIGHGPVIGIHLHASHLSDHSSLSGILILLLLFISFVLNWQGLVSSIRISELEQSLKEESLIATSLTIVELFDHGKIGIRERFLSLFNTIKGTRLILKRYELKLARLTLVVASSLA